MSVSCEKEITINVLQSSIPDAYWTLDEAGTLTNRVDKVHGVIMFQVAPGVITGAPALFSNGLAFIEAGFNSDMDSGFVPGLALQSSNGFSLWGWFKVLDWPVFGSYGIEKEMEYRNSIGPFLNVEMVWDTATQTVTFRFQDNTINTYNLTPFAPAIGTWYFFHLFFDPITTKVGYSINNGANVLGSAGAVYAANLDGAISFFQQWALANTPTNALLVDEFGMKLSRILTPAEVTFLYNGGAGRTWPL